MEQAILPCPRLGWRPCPGSGPTAPCLQDQPSSASSEASWPGQVQSALPRAATRWHPSTTSGRGCLASGWRCRVSAWRGWLEMHLWTFLHTPPFPGCEPESEHTEHTGVRAWDRRLVWSWQVACSLVEPQWVLLKYGHNNSTNSTFIRSFIQHISMSTHSARRSVEL